MYMSTEDARSDFILAGAAALVGPMVVALLARIPGYPSRGDLGIALQLVWVLAVTTFVPWWLVRYRQLGSEGYGYLEDRAGLRSGLLVALPVVVVGMLRTLGRGASLATMPLGRLWVGSPVVGDGPSAAQLSLSLLFVVAEIAVILAAVALLFPFLTVRAREGFRPTEIPLIEGLRTFGMGAAGVSLVLGLMFAFVPSVDLVTILLSVGGLVGMVLLADRLVTRKMRTTRATLLAPAILTILMHVLTRGGGLLGALFTGVLAAGTVVVIATLIETRRHAWAVLPVAVALVVYPTCLLPRLPFVAVSC